MAAFIQPLSLFLQECHRWLWTFSHLLFEKAMSTMIMVAVEPRFSGGHYRRPNASGGRITTQKNCRILQRFPMKKEEVTMQVIAWEPNVREAEWMQANRKELVERLTGVMHEDGTKELLPGLTLSRSSKPTEPIPGVFE